MRRATGYSLIELLVVLAILGVLASMAMPLADMSAERARERELKRALWEIRDALDLYKAARTSGAILPIASLDPVVPYPADLDTLTHLVPDQRLDHRGEYLRFLRSVPRDPFADASVSPPQTWATRSFLDGAGMAAGAPARGAVRDVYDIHSRSPALALNGTQLSDW
jgi:general secretion pathway protein G